MRTHELRFDVNCSILFTELPLPRRPAAAAAGATVLVEAMMGEDVPGTLARYGDRIGHMQIADPPDPLDPLDPADPADPADSSTSFGWP